jgi:hypothetical protein
MGLSGDPNLRAQKSVKIISAIGCIIEKIVLFLILPDIKLIV